MLITLIPSKGFLVLFDVVLVHEGIKKICCKTIMEMIVVKIAVFYVLLFSLIPKKVVANDESTGAPSKYMICFSMHLDIFLL